MLRKNVLVLGGATAALARHVTTVALARGGATVALARGGATVALVIGGATTALALVPAPAVGAAGAAGLARAHDAGVAGRVAASSPTVTVRVEGLRHTLLLPTIVHTHAGSITRGGAPAGACSATTAAGALDSATRHRWVGKWNSSFNDYEITSILGESHSFSTKYYWSIWIDNRYATTGACQIKLHRGDQLLFAVESTKTADPIAIKAPGAAVVGHTFNVTVVAFNEKGKSKPLAGATVSVAGHSGKTNSHGIVPLTPTRAGTLTITAQRAGYLRAAPVKVRVTG